MDAAGPIFEKTTKDVRIDKSQGFSYFIFSGAKISRIIEIINSFDGIVFHLETFSDLETTFALLTCSLKFDLE